MNLKATKAVHAPIFNCPNCNHEIKLTESLASPRLSAGKRAVCAPGVPPSALTPTPGPGATPKRPY
jgi:hypothetical protein